MSAWKTRIQPRYAEDPRLSDLVPGGVGERLVQALDRRLRVGSECRGQFEQNVGPLEALRNLGENLLQQQNRPGGFGGEAMERR